MNMGVFPAASSGAGGPKGNDGAKTGRASPAHPDPAALRTARFRGGAGRTATARAASVRKCGTGRSSADHPPRMESSRSPAGAAKGTPPQTAARTPRGDPAATFRIRRPRNRHRSYGAAVRRRPDGSIARSKRWCARSPAPASRGAPRTMVPARGCPAGDWTGASPPTRPRGIGPPPPDRRSMRAPCPARLATEPGVGRHQPGSPPEREAAARLRLRIGQFSHAEGPRNEKSRKKSRSGQRICRFAARCFLQRRLPGITRAAYPHRR